MLLLICSASIGTTTTFSDLEWPFRGASRAISAVAELFVSLLWNCLSVMDDARRVGGRSLQTQGPETAKHVVHTDYEIIDDKFIIRLIFPR